MTWWFSRFILSEMIYLISSLHHVAQTHQGRNLNQFISCSTSPLLYLEYYLSSFFFLSFITKPTARWEPALQQNTWKSAMKADSIGFALLLCLYN